MKDEVRGGDRVLVGTRAAVVIRCERAYDKAARRGRRIYLVRYVDDGTEKRVSRGQLSVVAGMPTEVTVGIYIASKAKHGARWLLLRAQGVPILSSWIDEYAPGATASYADLWTRNVCEAASAPALVVYVEGGEVLKGALVEVGAALASGRPVFWVGPHDGQTVAQHPLVTLCRTLKEALDLATQVTADARG